MKHTVRIALITFCNKNLIEHSFTNTLSGIFEESPSGAKAKVLDCSIIRSEFELQSRYCVHFRSNTPGERYEYLILPCMS